MITSKTQMYDMLAAGKFGNTVPMWFDLQRWVEDNYPDGWYGESLQWGVRTLKPGGPCRLYCPDAEVIETATKFIGMGCNVNISPMIETIRGMEVKLMANVWESPSGLIVEGIENPPRGSNWREVFKNPSQWCGLSALNTLKRNLNPNSLDDLRVLLDEHPGHVVELSATNLRYGTVPHRNAVIWEVRGAY